MEQVLHEEDFVQHVLFDTGRRRTRLGIVKKRGEAEPSQDGIDHPFFLRQRSYHFRRNWSYISFQFPFKSSYVFPHPFFETSKNKMDKFLFLGIHTRKRIMVDLLASLTVQPSSRGAPFLLGPQRQNVGLVPTVHHGRKDSPNRDH
ncbi:hypothetical protein C4D60_Mb08t16950 [Musa balbisiana]|uniref:Uncharacterized protein n=2 Tax=Musa balbisiana TaxID=52838 RepID=A0A4S8K4C4_MUSBA|nr:hypothetical protein C4D60_Mb00t01300 [Musa balbisiana]THU69681.1 hypothetical protein C4D60_Mb08t16950 [Musa balbisiana]